MRATVTIEKDILDELVKETKAKSKATAVRTLSVNTSGVRKMKRSNQ